MTGPVIRLQKQNLDPLEKFCRVVLCHSIDSPLQICLCHNDQRKINGMRILISNDDGVHAPGLKVLANELKKLADVWVVAPLEEKSTTGHSLTLHKPLRMIPMGNRFYGVSGSPADCVYLGIREVIKGMPDLVISGPNRGAN
jgi:hypothetical protein